MILNRILLNAHITKGLLEDGKVIPAHRKLSGVIDQLTKLHQSVSSTESEVSADQEDALAQKETNE